MRKWILILFLCGSIGVVLQHYHDAKSLDAFRPGFLAITFAIATFSVTFSLAGFNSSTYRQFHQAISPRLLSACMALLCLALLPLVALVFFPSWYISTCLIMLPILAISGVCLVEVARCETDPVTLLNRLCSVKAIEKYLHLLVPQIDERITESKALELTKIEDRPTHEFDWYLSVPPKKSDPLNCLATLGLLAIQQGDLHAFSCVVRRALQVLDLSEQFKPQKTVNDTYKIQSSIRSYVFDIVQRMMFALQRDKGTISLARTAIDTLAEFIVGKTREQRQTQDLVFAALHSMEVLSKHCYQSGSYSEIRVPLIVSRQITQKGLDAPPKVMEGHEEPMEVTMFRFNLPQLTNIIKHLGSYAIENGNSDFLYRCFDAFGWLGCSAVKRQNMPVATACLRALCQLGREGRAKGLECHWDRCALRPADHAAERIGWITTWVPKIPEEQRQHWIDLLNNAYSRLYGKETIVEVKTVKNGRDFITTKLSDKKHIEGYIIDGTSRDVDYSDFAFLKDLELYGGHGLMMSQITIPLVVAPPKNY